MNICLHRIRGLIGTGVTWSIPWGVLTGLIEGTATYFLASPPEALSRLGFAIQGGIAASIAGSIMGFGTGVLFSVVLMAAERRGAIDDLKMGRFAAWGATAGGAGSLPLIALAATGPGHLGVAVAAISLGVFATMGAVFASSTLAIARSDNQSDEAVLHNGSAPPAVSAGTE
jgi:hypothetical protein